MVWIILLLSELLVSEEEHQKIFLLSCPLWHHISWFPTVSAFSQWLYEIYDSSSRMYFNIKYMSLLLVLFSLHDLLFFSFSFKIVWNTLLPLISLIGSLHLVISIWLQHSDKPGVMLSFCVPGAKPPAWISVS